MIGIMRTTSCRCRVSVACSQGATAMVVKVAWARVIRQRRMNDISYITADVRCVGVVHVEVAWRRSGGGGVSVSKSRGDSLGLGEGWPLRYKDEDACFIKSFNCGRRGRDTTVIVSTWTSCFYSTKVCEVCIYSTGVIASQFSGRSSSSPTTSSLPTDILISLSLIRPCKLHMPTQSDARVD